MEKPQQMILLWIVDKSWSNEWMIVEVVTTTGEQAAMNEDDVEENGDDK